MEFFNLIHSYEMYNYKTHYRLYANMSWNHQCQRQRRYGDLLPRCNGSQRVKEKICVNQFTYYYAYILSYIYILYSSLTQHKKKLR